MWSYTGSRLFRRCQRQWNYKTKFGHHRAKDARRQEAYLLSKLQTLEAWRGSLVDDVITKKIVPLLKPRIAIHSSEIINYARRMFDEQAAFALKHRIREPGIKISNALAAFHPVEYGEKVTEQDINNAWSDVETALRNLLGMKELLESFRNAQYLYPQYILWFKHFRNETVRGIPDLIVAHRNQPPQIVDWKVNTWGTRDYRLQLATYAIALERCTSSSLPDAISSYTALDYQLTEVQLLTNQVRQYRLSESDIHNVEDYIATTSSEMRLLTENSDHLDPFNFSTTNSPDVCLSCNFRSLCWEQLL